MEELSFGFERRDGGWSDFGGQLQDGSLYVMAFAAGVPVPAVSQLQGQVEVNIIEFAQDEQGKITAACPAAPFDIATYACTQLEAPARLVSKSNFAIANCDLTEDFVHGVVDAVMSANQRMVDTHRAARSTLFEFLCRNAVTPWHPCAAKWCVESAGVELPADIIHSN